MCSVSVAVVRTRGRADHIGARRDVRSPDFQALSHVASGLLEGPIMNRTGMIPLALSVLALAGCADKPSNSASSAETTSARYPDRTMSSNVNDTSATGARADTAVPARDVNRSADASSTNGAFDNSAGAPGALPPLPPQSSPPKVTPVDQGNSSSDLRITQAIRKEVVSNGDLSFTAKNVKIITKGGRVTLKGEVTTRQERDSIEDTAIRVAGARNVDDQIVVKP